MSLHPVLAEKLSAALAEKLSAALAEKLSAALAEVPPPAITRRDARLPAVTGKAHAVIGMRRAGKTTFLRQLLSERRAAGPAERAVYLSFDDDRLASLELEQVPRSATSRPVTGRRSTSSRAGQPEERS